MTGLRFTPPPVEISNELRWVLGKAFGPAEAPPFGELDSRIAEELAVRLDLAPRIAARLGRQRLSVELGTEGASRMMEWAYAALGLGLSFERVARDVAGIAERAGVPVVLLKFAALNLSGVLTPGSRGCSDVDVLVASSLARQLQDCLVGAGFRRTDQPDKEHQLPGIVHPSGALVEVHKCLLGVRLDGSRSADIDALRCEGLLEALPGFPATASIPARDVLAAHAVVHGLVQHGSVPDSYPAFRMLADLADLAPDAARDRWARWISRDVSEAEIDALLSLRRELVEGRVPSGGGSDPASILLRHFLAGLLDRRYAGSLRIAGVFRKVTDHGHASSLFRQAWHALFPTGAELDHIYGPAPSMSGRLRRRVFRPFDVAWRAARYGLLAVRGRR